MVASNAAGSRLAGKPSCRYINAENGGSSSGGGSRRRLAAIWNLSNLSPGNMSNTVVINNTGSVALAISGFNFKAPLSNIKVTGNSASGIQMVTPVPKYENQSIELVNVQVVGNRLSPSSPQASAV